MNNNTINHYHGTLVRQQWPIGFAVKFKPKDLVNGEHLSGTVTGHLYVNLLIIKDTHNRIWHVSTFRCQPLINY